MSDLVNILKQLLLKYCNKSICYQQHIVEAYEGNPLYYPLSSTARTVLIVFVDQRLLINLHAVCSVSTTEQKDPQDLLKHYEVSLGFSPGRYSPGCR